METWKEYHRWLFDQTPLLATVVDGEGRVVEASMALAERLGVVRDELLQQRFADLATPRNARRIESEYLPLLRRRGQIEDMPVALHTHNGGTLDLSSSSAQYVEPGTREIFTFTVYTEIGDLAKVEARMRELYRSSPAMLHVLDDEGCILEVSDRWLSKLGYPREKVIGRSIHDFLSDKTNERLRKGQLQELFHAEELTNHPRELRARDGDILEVLMSAVAEHDEHGKLQRLHVASKDMTGRNRSERLLREAFAENARLRRELELERDYLREEVNVSMNLGHIVGSSPALQNLLARIEAVAQTPASVLICGESGTGKELVAHAIHARSPRADAPLVKVNCASIPDELFESEFFGHIKGAFTGAIRNRVGRFKFAHGGTLFLDEVSEIPLELQGKLLRVLQEQQFEPVGDDRTITVDVRVIAASNRDLRAEVQAGRFREDLYYRLSVFPVDVPPLRERGDDVTQLAVHFLDQICRDFGRETLALSQGQIERLQAYPWPGNIRELKNVLERAVILSSADTLKLDLPRDPALRPAGDTAAGTAIPESSQIRFLTDADLRERERENLQRVLEHTDWRVSGRGGAAELLGLKASTLTGRMKKFGLSNPAVRPGRPAQTY